MRAMGLEKMRLHSEEALQIWLASEVEVREELEALIGHELGLDAASLDDLEAFMLARYPSPDEALVLGAREILDAAARHVGLVMLLGIEGAEWTVDLKHERNVYYRLPIIRLPDTGEECPLTIVTGALGTRTGHYMREVVETYLEDYGGGGGE